VRENDLCHVALSIIVHVVFISYFNGAIVKGTESKLEIECNKARMGDNVAHVTGIGRFWILSFPFTQSFHVHSSTLFLFFIIVIITYNFRYFI